MPREPRAAATHTSNGYGPIDPDFNSFDPDPEPEESTVVEEETIVLDAAAMGDIHNWLDRLVEQRENNGSRWNRIRAHFYQQYLVMAATYREWERDLLNHRASHLFAVRVEVIRKDLAPYVNAHGGATTKITPTVLSGDFIADIVYCPNQTPSVKYLQYEIATGETALNDEITQNNVRHTPPSFDELVTGEITALKLATGIEEYGSTMDLIRDVRAYLNHFVALEPDFAILSAAYALYTWGADRIPLAPYFNCVGDFQAGKSTWLQVIGQIVCRGLSTTGITTPAGLYRSISLCRPTLLVDEADFNPRDPMWSAIRTVLNSGNTPRTPIIVNESTKNGRGWVPTIYTSFGPKILAMRRPFPDQALASRCLTETFRSRELPEHIPLILDDELDERAAPLRNKLLLWRFRNLRQIHVNTRARLRGVEPRINAIANALLATCDGEDTVSLRRLILGVAQRHSDALRISRGDSLEGVVAAALIQQWTRYEYPADVKLKGIVERVQQHYGDHREDLSSEKIAAVLRGPLGFKPTRRGGQSHVVTPEADMRELGKRYDVSIREPVR